MAELTPLDWEVLRGYAAHDMGLKTAAQELHMHVNTLRYHLSKVYELTGIDPRSFRGLVELLYPGAVERKEDVLDGDWAKSEREVPDGSERDA